MICLFLNTDDVPAIWLFDSLKQRGVENIFMISADELAYAAEFTCEIENGKSAFNIKLQNGLELNNKNVNTALNRISYLPHKLAAQFTPADRDYVAHEQLAVFTFFLNLVPNQLFNSSSGKGLSGRHRSTLEWMQLAQLAGFITGEIIYENFVLHNPDYAGYANHFSVLYFNNKCFGLEQVHNHSLEDMCLRLGQLSGENILEMDICNIEGQAVFKGANTLPSFKGANEAFLTELKSLL